VTAVCGQLDDVLVSFMLSIHLEQCATHQ
jgi:hypothetical protein